MVTQVHYVLEVVQNLLCGAGFHQQQTVVYVHKADVAEQHGVQQDQVYIVALEQMDFVQQTEVQTVD